MNRSDLQNLATVRLAEASALLAAGYPSGAYYLAGYAVECALKAVIARRTEQYEFPDKGRALESFTHKTAQLIRAAQINNQFETEIDADESFNRNWKLVSFWSEASRYDIHTAATAQDMIAAVADTEHGVLQWIMRYW